MVPLPKRSNDGLDPAPDGVRLATDLKEKRLMQQAIVE
jgi:hypothetical protein